MINLICIETGGESKNYNLTKKRIIIGRDTDCDIIFREGRVSRNHCEIIEDNGEYIIRDLNSTNGTYVNSKKIMEAKLFFEDRIQIGKHIFKFVSDASSMKPLPHDTSAPFIEIIRTADKPEAHSADRTHISQGKETYFEDDFEIITSEYRKLKRGYGKLILFFNLSNALIKIASNEELITNIEELLLKEFNFADRCAIFIIDEKTGQPFAIREKSKIALDEQEKKYPQELIDKAITQKKSFNAVEGVTTKKKSSEKTTEHIVIRSMMISPMCIKDKIIGLIYVENWTQPYCFDDFDLELLGAFANQIAIAFENNSLYEKLDKSYEKAYADFLAEYQEKRKATEEIQRQLQRITALHKISQTLASRISAEELYPLIFEKIRDIIPVDAFFIAYIHDINKELTPLICYDTTENGIARTIDFSKFKSDKIQVVFSSQQPMLIFKKDYLDFLKKKSKKSPESIIYAPMKIGNNVVGIMSVQSYQKNIYDDSHVELLQNIANQAALFIENARLFDSLKHQQQILEKHSSEIINAQELERKRIARELHDGIGQILSAIKINLEIVRMKALGGGQGVAESVSENAKLVDRILDDLRRISHDLRPSMLDDFGLAATIQEYVKEYQNLTGIKVKLDVNLPKDAIFKPEQEINLFRIIQEGFTNIIKHAKATESKVFLNLSNGKVKLAIEDNGIGFDETKIPIEKKKKAFGILNMQERTKMLHGEFKIISSPNKGTKIDINFPIKKL